MSEQRPPLRRPRLLPRPLRTFLNTEAAGGIVLLVAAVAALVWANSPFSDSYAGLWETEFRVAIGFEITEELRGWVNDGLMTLFFFVVGLEIKRELISGELNDARKAALPAIAALGGMVGPALLYTAFNAGGPGANGWGIPMATDIAFAVGVLALLGDRIPSGLRVFVLSLAIVDDIGAIVVIALFYSSGLHIGWLIAAAALLVLVAVLPRVGIVRVPVYVVLGLAVWLATFESGIHATIAGVALGLLTPARGDGSVAERLERRLHPWTSYIVVPVFALANAGVALGDGVLRDAFSSRVALGIVAGLVVGKIVGISTASWLSVRFGLGRLPDGVAWSHLVGAAAVAGIGFTVSLFITALAFDDASLVAPAKLAILVASVIAGTLGAVILLAARCPAEPDPGL